MGWLPIDTYNYLENWSRWLKILSEECIKSQILIWLWISKINSSRLALWASVHFSFWSIKISLVGNLLSFFFWCKFNILILADEYSVILLIKYLLLRMIPTLESIVIESIEGKHNIQKWNTVKIYFHSTTKTFLHLIVKSHGVN